MHRLTGGRFTLGLGRGIAPLFDAYGIPRITTAQIEDFVGLMRRLWKGEVVFGHDGPAGKFPVLHLDSSFDEDIPLGFVAFGPNSLALAGRASTRWCSTRSSPTRPSNAASRPSARRPSGGPRSRDGPHLVVLRDHRRPSSRRAPAEEDGRPAGHVSAGLRRSAGRDQRLGPGRARALPRRRGRLVVSRARSTPRPTPRCSSTSPRCCPTSGWSPRPPAIAARCAERVLRQFDLGVDGVIMHGATPIGARPGRRGLPRDPAPRPLRRLARNPGRPRM